ncbi:plasmid stability protein [Bradyrhizobium sp. USDA 4471]
MASLTIRKLDDAVKTYLRLRSARNHRSVEEEVRVILRELIEGREQALTPFAVPPEASPAPCDPTPRRRPRGQHHTDHRRRHCGFQVARPDPQAEGAADRGALRADQGRRAVRDAALGQRPLP